jgi:hypothetical protein
VRCRIEDALPSREVFANTPQHPLNPPANPFTIGEPDSVLAIAALLLTAVFNAVEPTRIII